MIETKVIADSIANGIRLTTMELNYPRFIHSEVMTHRMFSRNASSSRAMPIQKMLDQVRENPAMPIHWGKNQPGMQAREELDEYRRSISRMHWGSAVISARKHADLLYDIGAHKQIVNRVLEPFQWIKVIVTATEWDNFFKLRLHEDAQPEMYELARCMKEAMLGSKPTLLEYGEWHLPYVYINGGGDLKECIKMSVARCARISFLNHDNSTPNIDKDIALYGKLLEAGHMSPFEHVATPMRQDSFNVHAEEGITHIDKYDNLWSGNFRGWIQYRQLLLGNTI